jgi:hypothetical protein
MTATRLSFRYRDEDPLCKCSPVLGNGAVVHIHVLKVLNFSFHSSPPSLNPSLHHVWIQWQSAGSLFSIILAILLLLIAS